ncbi:MAG: hypothetical protein WCP67_09760 [Verrucomicrobiota bacterium]
MRQAFIRIARRTFAVLGMLLFACLQGAETSVTPHDVPWEFGSSRYSVTVNGRPVQSFLAAMNLHFVSFDMTSKVEIEVTINDNDYNRHDGRTYLKSDKFWGEQAVIRPTQAGIKAKTQGRKVTFSIDRPGQFSVERVGAHHFEDETLFIFANPPEATPAPATDPSTIRLGPGIHRRSVDLKSGQTLYLAPGAVLYGAINVWDAQDVRIHGRGVVVYEGPNARNFDSGWMVRPDWHPLTTRNVRRLSVEGVTFVNRARTWSLQFTRTFESDFNNIKIIAATPENLNCDGMDWYGGGKATVRNSFVRCADDCFAFHTEDSSIALRVDRGGGGHIPGAPQKKTPPTQGEFSDLTIEKCVLWPTVANVIRAGWNNQSLKSRRILMKDCDVINMESPLRSWLGASWALFTAVEPEGEGECLHEDYRFEDIRIETSAALIGVNWPRSTLRRFVFKDIKINGEAGKSLLRCRSEDILMQNVNINGKTALSDQDMSLHIEGEANNLRYSK